MEEDTNPCPLSSESDRQAESKEEQGFSRSREESVPDRGGHMSKDLELRASLPGSVSFGRLPVTEQGIHLEKSAGPQMPDWIGPVGIHGVGGLSTEGPWSDLGFRRIPQPGQAASRGETLETGGPEGGWAPPAGVAVSTVGTGGARRRSHTPLGRQAGDGETGYRSDGMGFQPLYLPLLNLRFLSLE